MPVKTVIVASPTGLQKASLRPLAGCLVQAPELAIEYTLESVPKSPGENGGEISYEIASVAIVPQPSGYGTRRRTKFPYFVATPSQD